MSDPNGPITRGEFNQFEKRVELALKHIDENVALALAAKHHNTSLYISFASLAIALAAMFWRH